jgi:hypothetical protein
MKGMMAAGAAIAAMPYLANLAGSVQSSPIRSAPAVPQTQASPTNKISSSTSSLTSALSNDAETIVLVIKNDMISGFKGMQKIKLQDAELARSLKGTVKRRFE